MRSVTLRRPPRWYHAAVRNVLLVAFHFPPLVGSSGIQRTLRFAQYLPEFGWRPTVLTIVPQAYEAWDDATLDQVPAGCEIVRARGYDAARQLSIAGRYPGFLAIPDRWASWAWLGARLGARTCRERSIDVVWSTYPIASAHRLGAAIARRTGLPWVADFRDPMAQPGYPADPRRWRAYRAIEETAAREAARMVFVTPSALQSYRELFPAVPAERFELLANGFDESVFESAGKAAAAPRAGQPAVLLHSGIVYPSERDPTALMDALAALKSSGRLREGRFVIRFRAPVHADLIIGLAAARGVEGFVEIAPPIPYREAIAEMMSVDALLVMQGQNCNAQIPAKLYEYLRAGRPMLGLADPAGDTGRTMLDVGVSHVATLEDAGAIERTLPEFVDALEQGRVPTVPRERIDRFSRRALTGALAGVLARVARA